MSNCTLEHAMLRIMKASDGEELAAFPGERPGTVNIVFARTIETARWIETGQPKLLGIFDNRSDYEETRMILQSACDNVEVRQDTH